MRIVGCPRLLTNGSLTIGHQKGRYHSLNLACSTGRYAASSSSNALASLRSAVSKPSVNQL